MDRNDDESELWEALDVDDSDLSVLRRCNRRPAATSSSIPGPAAAVQAAMRRRIRPDRGGEDPVSTQEYIQRVLDGGGSLAAEVDEDFAANPWLFALDSLPTLGFGSVPGTALSSIKNGIHSDRIDLVVAIVKSCTRTDLGDLMVTLKDRSGTMGASIHRKVLSEEDYAKNMSVGAVLILKKVALFAPTRSAYYLNITLSNVVKIISKDSGPPLKWNFSTMSAGYSAPSSESIRTSQIPQEIRSQDKIQGIMRNLIKNSESRVSMVTGTNATPETRFFTNKTHKADKESFFRSNVMPNKIVDVTVTATEKHTISEPNIFKFDGRDNNVTPNPVDVRADPEIKTSSRTELHKNTPVSSVSIPDWTEEELDQLGVFDD